MKVKVATDAWLCTTPYQLVCNKQHGALKCRQISTDATAAYAAAAAAAADNFVQIRVDFVRARRATAVVVVDGDAGKVVIVINRSVIYRYSIYICSKMTAAQRNDVCI
jgi:hypothetical protein